MRDATAFACLGLLSAILLSGCGDDPAKSTGERYESAEAFLAARRGEVVVLVLGMESCANTRAATRVVSELAADGGNGIAAARLDVPPPGGTLAPVENWSLPIAYFVDQDRRVAESLSFFYYPTLYVLDGDGEVRYSGSCEKEKLRAMVAEIRAEKPGGEKKLYTRPLPPVGSQAARIRGKCLDGADFDLEDHNVGGPTLVFFGSVDCPFSMEAARSLLDVEIDFEEQGAAVLVIEKGKSTPKSLQAWGDIDLTGPVVADPDGSIFRSYSVEPVPFFFLLDEAGKIAARGPYTEPAARNALRAVLGLEQEGAEGGGGAG